MTSGQTFPILREVGNERFSQIDKFGVQHHDVAHWMLILAEEVGEASIEAGRAVWGDNPRLALDLLRKELIQTAAVAVQIVEAIDNGALLDSPGGPVVNAAAPAAEQSPDQIALSAVPGIIAWYRYLEDQCRAHWLGRNGRWDPCESQEAEEARWRLAAKRLARFGELSNYLYESARDRLISDAAAGDPGECCE